MDARKQCEREWRRVERLMALSCWFESSWLGRRRGAWLRRRYLPPPRPSGGGGPAGVREPRRPRPSPLTGSAALPIE